MKRRLWGALGVLLLCCATVFAVVGLELAAKAKPELPALLPEGALLSIEARDLGGLLKDWNTSDEKHAWLISDNHAAFSNSRLFNRLSQAKDEFSAAAGIPTGQSLLEKVAGKESCLALYDIGNLEFVYVTRLDQQGIENTPLWQTRGKFEQRAEAGTTFYVHKDAQSSRVAAFASRDGWLILGTREDLVAGVLDRLAGTASHSVASEEWYAAAVKQAAGERGDLRMVLDLDRIVRTPYFRSYWVQRNITEIRRYTSAVSDLYRTSETYREERVLLRRTATTTAVSAVSQGDVAGLVALAPSDAAFYAAQSMPDSESVLRSLRGNLLEVKPDQSIMSYTTAPSAAFGENAGNAAQLDVLIDRAPVAAPQTDIFQPLRALLAAAEPDGLLEVYSTRAPGKSPFVSLQTGMVISSPRAWDGDAVRKAVTSALPSGLTTGKLGVHWKRRSSAAGEYQALDGTVSLYTAVSGNRLLLANDSSLLEQLLARAAKSGSDVRTEGVTYAALFRPMQEQRNFRVLMTQLDRAGNRGAVEGKNAASGGETPAFFSGNVASLARAFSKVESERVQENDLGGKVTQTVIYQWAR